MKLAISNYQLAINQQLTINNVAAFHSPSLIANILPIANSTWQINSKGAN